MQRLAQALDAVRATRSRKSKVEALAGLFRSLSRDELSIAARLILGELLPPQDLRQLGVGWALVVDAVVAAANAEASELSECMRRHGDLGDAAAELLSTHASVQSLPTGLSLLQTHTLIEELASTPQRPERIRLLTEAFQKAHPAEAGYLVKALMGELRVGVQLGILEEGIARAFNRPLPELRKASALLDIGTLVVAAHDGTLHEAAAQVGAPISFMLATPAESVKTPLETARTIAEDKLDGIRAQAHVDGESVRLFARGQGEVTGGFPEVVSALAGLHRRTIFDGEIIAIAPDGKARPFHVLQARIGRRSPAEALLNEVPVAYVAYDVLFDEASILDWPFEKRRERLEALLGAKPTVVVNPIHRFSSAAAIDAQIEQLFLQARGRGNEGLVLKHLDAPYEAGRRGSAWRKVKKAGGTLDCVVTKAEWGHGKRKAVLSDYTFAVWKGDALVDIGKAYSGLTDAEIATLTEIFQKLTIAHVNGVLIVKPEIVLEIAFDGLQKSARHASGFSMRFPRIVRIRNDKTPEQADTLETAAALFKSHVQSGHREEPETETP